MAIRRHPGRLGRILRASRRLGAAASATPSPITFPTTPLDTIVYVAPVISDLNADPYFYVWQPLSANYVYWRDSVRVRRGMVDGTTVEQVISQPAQLNITLKDAPGRYAWGRGTPIRVDLNVGGPNHQRFTGQVTTMAPRSDTSGNERYRAVVAHGILHRIQTGSTKLAVSCLRSYIETVLASITTTDTFDLVGYWPLELGPESTVDGTEDMVASGTVTFGAQSNLAIGTLPLPTMTAGKLTAAVPSYTPTDPNGNAAFGVIFAATGDCRVATWEDADGKLYALNVVADHCTFTRTVGGSTFSIELDTTGTGFTTFADGVAHSFGGQVTGDGTDQFPVGAVDTFTSSTVLAGAGGVARITRVTLNPDTSPNLLSVGHATVCRNGQTGGGDQRFYIDGAVDEDAPTRFARIMRSNRIPWGFIDIPQGQEGVGSAPDQDGDHFESPPRMGAQRNGTVIAQIEECGQAERGQIVDAMTGQIHLRLHNESERRAVDLAADVALGQVQPSFEPQDDDQNQRNDITVQTSDGDFGRDFEPYGPLGVTRSGTYDIAPTINLSANVTEAPQNWASYMVMAGTQFELRVGRARLDFAKNPELLDAWLAMADPIRCRFQVLNPSATISLDTLDQTIVGYEEVWNSKQYYVDLTLIQYVPIFVAGSTNGNEGRLDNPGSTLVADLDATTASFQVASPGALWSTTAANYVIGIEGQPWEPVTVLSVTGSSSPQTFTVVRHASGVPHLAGSQVRLWRPGTVALMTRASISGGFG